MGVAIPKVLLPHQVSIQALDPAVIGGLRTALVAPAYVEEKVALIRDERATSETSGQEITMTHQVIVAPFNRVDPGSRLTWNGTELEVAAVASYDHPNAPSHVILWTV